MTYWRTTGEVFDSEDDSSEIFGSFVHGATLPDLTLEDGIPTAEESARNTEHASVWNLPVPGSPSSREASLRSDHDHGCVVASDSPGNAKSGLDRSSPGRSPKASLIPFDDISNNFGELSASQARSIQSSPLSEAITIATPSASPEASQNQSPAQKSNFASVTLAQQAASPSIHALRPRKPIQQHPYLVENMLYTRIFKSHGLKPVRCVVDSGRTHTRHKSEEEDSQEHEYEADDSQEQGGLVLAESAEDGGPILFEDELNDLMYLEELASISVVSKPRMSSQVSDGNRTDATSISEEEFPSLDRLGSNPQKRRTRSAKRVGILKTYKTNKRRKPGTPPPGGSATPTLPASVQSRSIRANSPSLSPQLLYAASESSPNRIGLQSQEGAEICSSLNRHATLGCPRQWPVSVLPSESPAAIYDLSDCTDRSSEFGESEDDEGDALQENRKRIRGVLPASWLRLDQQKSRVLPSAIRSPTVEARPELLPRKGVAVRRVRPSSSITSRPYIFDDEDEEEDSFPTTIGHSRVLDELPTLVISDDDPEVPEDDDCTSVVEEDYIDRMLPGRNKRRADSCTVKTKKRKLTRATIKERPSHGLWQPRISQMFNITHETTRSSPSKTADINARERTRENRRKRIFLARPKSPPRLGIVDVVQPDAPQFIKVASRTAKTRKSVGRSSPASKLISFAARMDNVDALSTLQDWNLGKIKARLTVPSAAPRGPGARQALQVLYMNPVAAESRTHAKIGYHRPTRLPRHSKTDSLLESRKAAEGLRRRTVEPVMKRRLHEGPAGLRPAQLETDEEQSQQGFQGVKKFLDIVYGRGRQDRLVGVSQSPTDGSMGPVTSRSRKTTTPRRVDLGALQFTRANDPLPLELVTVRECAGQTGQDRLKGLGPFGTRYSHHFEVFPLERGVFFHASTSIGRGCITKAMSAGLPERVRQGRPSISFRLDERVMSWGQWTVTVADELGIVVDWIAEGESQVIESDRSGVKSRKIAKAADFVLDYILDSFSLPPGTDEKASLLRYVDVFESYLGRAWSRSSSVEGQRLHLDVASRFLIALLALCRISRAWGVETGVQNRIERTLQHLASMTVETLLQVGLEDLRTLYGDLQRFHSREGGIRPDQVLATSWVVVMRVLEGIGIPGTSFWDVTHGVMLRDHVLLSSDAETIERVWKDTVTLLPLGEMDDAGLLRSGSRHVRPMEGWAMPQKVLKLVFDLYKQNPRQAASFNGYCRALVGRCHFLIQQWGWVGERIVGTIFDFFGSQGLAHLRNEESYSSPKFLDLLAEKPSLDLEAEDRCFHIFIKSLALTIQRLGKDGRLKDVKNLVNRTLPNHNRQYLKEDVVHQHDLAALRNHHDLLCTLFWAAPPKLRPAVHLIEKLVATGSSHKEACLINIRAWNRLARYSVSLGEDVTTFRHFNLWRNSIFDQMLAQYKTAASDMEQQFVALPKGIQGMNLEMKDIIARNRATVLDTLHHLLLASLDVLRHAVSLKAMVVAFGISHVQQIFSSFHLASSDFDWRVLEVGLEMVDLYLERVEKANEDQYASDQTNPVDEQQLSDAVMLLLEKLGPEFFSLGRTVINLPVAGVSIATRLADPEVCAEKVVKISARMAVRFKDAGISLSTYFRPGRYGLFSALPKDLTATSEKRYLPLFVAGLVKHGVFRFNELGSSLLGVWTLAIIKPSHCLKYEHYLANVLKQENMGFLDKSSVGAGREMEYTDNVMFFALVMDYMRKSLGKAGSTQEKRALREDYAGILRLVMQKMREDVVLLKAKAKERRDYMDFIREVIALITSHGVGICEVDKFFLHPSVDYLPPMEDPKLHLAGIIKYAVRIGEKDFKAVPELFHYLYGNFKTALVNHELDQEATILAKAIHNEGITTFLLQYMLPAIIQATRERPCVWPLLELYLGALCDRCLGSEAPRRIRDDDLGHVAVVLKSILHWLTASNHGTQLSLQQLHVAELLMRIAKVLQLDVQAYVRESRGDDYNLVQTFNAITDFSIEAGKYLQGLLGQDEGFDSVSTSALLRGLATDPPSLEGAHPRVREFSAAVVADVRNNWHVGEDGVVYVVGGPRGSLSTQPSRELAQRLRGMRELAEALYQTVISWDLCKEDQKDRDGRFWRLTRYRSMFDVADLIF